MSVEARAAGPRAGRGAISNWKIGRNFEYFNSREDFMPAKTEFVRWFVSAAVNGSLEVVYAALSY